MNAKYRVDANEYQKFLKSEEKKKQNSEKRKRHREEIGAKYKWLTPETLCNALGKKFTDYDWTYEQSLKGLGTKERVDVVGERKTGSPIICVEIEGGQTRPVSNVVKIWRHIHEGKLISPVLLVQVFSPFYSDSEGAHHTRMEEAIFTGKQADELAKRLRYIWLEPDSWPISQDQLASFVDRISLLITDYVEKFKTSIRK